MRAFTKGCIGTDSPDEVSSKDLTRAAIIARELAEQDRVRRWELEIQHECSKLATTAAAKNPSKLCSKIEDNLEDLKHKLERALRPWLAKKKPDRRKSEYKKLLSDWQEAWGDLNSPETQEKIRRTVEELNRRNRKGRRRA